MLKVCFWSTTFQSDNHALAEHLARAEGCDVTVALPHAAAFAAETVHALRPLPVRLLDRDSSACDHALKNAHFDLLIVDNHLPSFMPAERMLVLWHGFGWRIDDLAKMRKELARLVGDVTKSNERFRWQAFGEWDRHYRITHSRLAPENVVALGSPYADWLRRDGRIAREFERSAHAAHYTIDHDKPVVLLALTWHHGGSLGHWGDEETLLEDLVSHIARQGAQVLLRMHDRHRYTRDYRRIVERVAERHPRDLMLKWKNSSPDSLIDILCSDVCISNYSSLLNAFYHTERPSIHVDPHDAQAAKQATYTMFFGRPMRRSVNTPQQMWKLPPEENGGLRARTFEELLAHIDRALAEPECCRERSRAFVERYIAHSDGASCARAARYLQQWCGERTSSTTRFALQA